MKLKLLAVIMTLTVMIAGCTFTQPLQIEARWVPHMSSDASYWRLLVSADMTTAREDTPLSWHINWGDGTVEEWSNGERNWPKYPLDYSRFASIHEYTEDGEYVVTLSVQGNSASIAIVVGGE